MLERLKKTRVPEFSSSGVAIRTEYLLGSFPIGREKGCSFAIYDRVYRNIAHSLAMDLSRRYQTISYEMMSGIQPPGNARGNQIIGLTAHHMCHYNQSPCDYMRLRMPVGCLGPFL